VAGEHRGFAGIVFTGQHDEAASFGFWCREEKKIAKEQKKTLHGFRTLLASARSLKKRHESCQKKLLTARVKALPFNAQRFEI